MKSGEIQLNGKLFVSSKRAAEIAGYATDYIGQLCRSGKLETTRLGRSWYVSVDSLESYQRSLEEPSTENTPDQEADTANPEIAGSATTNTTLKTLPNSPTKGFVYSEDTRSLLPSLSKRISESAVPQIVTSVQNPLDQNLAKSFLAFDELPESLKAKINLARSKSQDASRAPLPLFVKQPKKKTGLLFSGFAFVGVGLVLIGAIFSSGAFSLNESVVAQVREAFAQDEGTGIVVEEVDQKNPRAQIEKIKTAFSDEVQVVEDPSGTTGVITPVFKGGRTGNDFVFVLVPVKEK
ncbi:MAG: helix-turn-helix domain-containing protein [Candidatus Paceibacterota bacterium]